MNNWNVHELLLHYLDDYFTLGPPNSDICASRLKAIDQAATEIGIPLSPEKCVGPTTCLIFLFISTDASGSKGYGAFYSGEWFNGSWSAAQQPLSIAYKELFPIVIACYVWGNKWRCPASSFAVTIKAL